ncbi:MAG: CopG family antitoxin [Gammaproteobacteria bacterium]
MTRDERKLNPPYLDEEERQLMEAMDAGEFRSVDNFEVSKRELERAAKETLRKRAISIRLMERDIQRMKQLAAKDGIPYQTLIASVIHRYAEGTLKRSD